MLRVKGLLEGWVWIWCILMTTLTAGQGREVVLRPHIIGHMGPKYLEIEVLDIPLDCQDGVSTANRVAWEDVPLAVAQKHADHNVLGVGGAALNRHLSLDCQAQKAPRSAGADTPVGALQPSGRQRSGALVDPPTAGDVLGCIGEWRRDYWLL